MYPTDKDAHHDHQCEPRGRYFEDFEIGQEIVTPARTITSTDIVNFACLTGDFNEVHTNFEYCKTTPFGEPIAHGPLIYGIMGGLQYASGINDGTLLGLLGIDQWRMLGPVKHGDTIRVVQKVVEKKETSKPDRGVITFQRQCVKQDGSVVQEMKATLMYKRRPKACPVRSRVRRGGHAPCRCGHLAARREMKAPRSIHPTERGACHVSSANRVSAIPDHAPGQSDSELTCHQPGDLT
jgi:acyl dehydratase